ncbi:unnamed protein product [Discosporangium mesarthrocarpum]
MQCLVLVSSVQVTIKQETDQRRTRDLLNAKGLIFEELDAADESNHPMRDELIDVSGVHGYPQLFLEGPQGVMFVGGWEDLADLVETDDLPEEYVKAHPEVETFDTMFEGVPRGKPKQDLPHVW